jgi:hypothetical protein
MTVERHLLSRKFSPHHGEEIEKKSAFVKKREENSNQAHIGTCIKFSYGVCAFIHFYVFISSFTANS